MCLLPTDAQALLSTIVSMGVGCYVAARSAGRTQQLSRRLLVACVPYCPAPRGESTSVLLLLMLLLSRCYCCGKGKMYHNSFVAVDISLDAPLTLIAGNVYIGGYALVGGSKQWRAEGSCCVCTAVVASHLAAVPAGTVCLCMH